MVLLWLMESLKRSASKVFKANISCSSFIHLTCKFMFNIHFFNLWQVNILLLPLIYLLWWQLLSYYPTALLYWHRLSYHPAALFWIVNRDIFIFCFSTFVCPTEIIAFSDRIGEFKAINTAVVACSVDSHFTHLAW